MDMMKCPTAEIHLFKYRRNKCNCFIKPDYLIYIHVWSKYVSGNSCCSRWAPEGDCCIGCPDKHCIRYKRLSCRTLLACRKLHVFSTHCGVLVLLPGNDYSIKHCFFPLILLCYCYLWRSKKISNKYVVRTVSVAVYLILGTVKSDGSLEIFTIWGLLGNFSKILSLRGSFSLVSALASLCLS